MLLCRRCCDPETWFFHCFLLIFFIVSIVGCTSNKVNYYGEGGGGGSGSVPLSIGAIIGIVVGVLGGITLITALVVWIVVQRRRGKSCYCLFSGHSFCI